MLEIITHSIGDYKDVTIKTNTTVIELGLLSLVECEELAHTLRETANELKEG